MRQYRFRPRGVPVPLSECDRHRSAHGHIENGGTAKWYGDPPDLGRQLGLRGYEPSRVSCVTGVEPFREIDDVAADGVVQWGPATRTISAAVQFRGGCVRRHPQVYDFTITAVINTPLQAQGGEGPFGSDTLDDLLKQLAEVLGHRMLWWPEDAEALRHPVQWPIGIGGPRLPLLDWQIRPSAENVAMWIAGRLGTQIESLSPHTKLVALELRESPYLAAVVRGVDIEDCKGFPGPRARG